MPNIGFSEESSFAENPAILEAIEKAITNMMFAEDPTTIAFDQNADKALDFMANKYNLSQDQAD